MLLWLNGLPGMPGVPTRLERLLDDFKKAEDPNLS
jgi:hypothetical protein